MKSSTVSSPVRPPRVAAALLAGWVCVACAGNPRLPPVLDPPRLDLRQYGHVGLARFTVEGGKGALDELATERFSEYALAAQPGIEVLEVGSADSVRQRVGEQDPGPATAQALGTARGVPAIFFGHLKISDVKRSGGLQGFVPFIKATVSLQLTVGLFATQTGGTLWRASATRSEEVGELQIVDGLPSFTAKDPRNAYGHIVNELVEAVTYDLRPTWREQ